MKTAIVLSGGGAKGAFQVGAIKRLTELGVSYDAIYGTSVGALNAAAIAYKGIKYTEEQWLTIKGRGDVLSFNWSTLLGLSKGVYNMNPLREYLEQTVQGDKPLCEAVVCKVSLLTGEIIYSRSSTESNKDFIDSTIQSATIPFVMEPTNNMADGGMREQTPLKQAIEDGYEKIIAILCNPTAGVADPWTEPKGFFKQVKYGLRAIDLLEHEVFVTDLQRVEKYNEDNVHKKIDITWYAPEKLMIDTLEFDPEKIRLVMKQGYDSVK